MTSSNQSINRDKFVQHLLERWMEVLNNKTDVKKELRHK